MNVVRMWMRNLSSVSLLFAGVALVLSACTNDAISGPGFQCDVTNPVEDLLLKPTSGIILVHSPARAADTATVVAQAINRVGGVRTDVPIHFVSSDTTVATVDSLGVVHALKPGTIKITASTCGKKATADITVALLAISVEVKFDTATIVAGDSVLVRARAHAQGTNALIPNVKFTFSVSPSAGVNVSQRSDSTAMIKTVATGGGTIVVTATGEGVSGSAALAVVQRIVDVTLDTVAVVAGDSLFVTARAHALGSKVVIPSAVFTFSASPTAGVTITQRSTSTGLIQTSSAGTYVITANNEGVTGSATLTVLPRIFVGDAAVADGGLDVGRDFSCGLIPLGRLYCWGVNGTTQLATQTDSLCYEEQVRGGATRPCTLYPLRVAPTTLAFSLISAGDSFACGLTTTGAAYCWGSGAFGKLGNGHNGGASVASVVTSALSFNSVSAGGEHACGLTLSGAAYCWGQDSVGQLGDARHVNSTTPIPVLQGGGVAVFASITAGFRHTCALRSDGAAFCWGRDSTGELGIGGFNDTDTPAAVVGGLRFTSISAGGDTVQTPLEPLRVESHVCAIAVGGGAYCWGSNRSGQLGTGTIGDSSAVPVAVSGGLTFSRISAGSRHTCGLTTTGAVYCWGRNLDLQLGRGPVTGGNSDSGTPQLVAGGDLPPGVTFTAVSAGTRHSCGVGSDGAAYCWGSNVFGALGNTLQAAFRGFPQRVATPK